MFMKSSYRAKCRSCALPSTASSYGSVVVFEKRKLPGDGSVHRFHRPFTDRRGGGSSLSSEYEYSDCWIGHPAIEMLRVIRRSVAEIKQSFFLYLR